MLNSAAVELGFRLQQRRDDEKERREEKEEEREGRGEVERRHTDLVDLLLKKRRGREEKEEGRRRKGQPKHPRPIRCGNKKKTKGKIKNTTRYVAFTFCICFLNYLQSDSHINL
ncbi:hypothetical protein ACOSP7_023813 [Xanthoceras sorbifolium]